MLQQTPAPPVPHPQTRAELDALLMTRNELSNQMQTLSARRTELWAQMINTGEPRARAELQSRVAQMDARIARLEEQVLRADDAIATALSHGVGMDAPAVQAVVTVPPRETGLNSGAERIIAAEGLVIIILALAFWRYVRKMKRAPRTAADDARLQQLGQAVDAIAVEVERISEGQRYVAKLLTDKLAIGSGAAEPVEVRRGEAVPVGRTDRES